jgi:hypothetical protein
LPPAAILLIGKVAFRDGFALSACHQASHVDIPNQPARLIIVTLALTIHAFTIDLRAV